jgi:hypothetical protein
MATERLMTEFPHQPKRVSRLEVCAFALAAALVALIAIGVVPRGTDEGTASMTTAGRAVEK